MPSRRKDSSKPLHSLIPIPLWISLIVISFFSGLYLYPFVYPDKKCEDRVAVQNTSQFEVCFTPSSTPCLPLILNALQKAQKRIALQGYGFTAPLIAQALIKAHRQGVQVTVILDKSQKKAPYSKKKWLMKEGIPVFFDYKPAIAHNKVLLIDSDIVITGSYNWTNAAESRNAENLILIRDSSVFQKYWKNFQNRLEQCKR